MNFSGFRSVSAGLAVLVGVLTVNWSANYDPVIAQESAPAVTSRSTAQEIALAKHLKKIGAKLYTAYWCPHCHRQTHLFGKEAVKHLAVIECDPNGVNQQSQLCSSKKIRGYPTWEINGRFYPGVRSLRDLARISNYSGGN